MVFIAVFALTILCLLGSFWLTTHDQSPAIANLNDKLLSVFTLGCGAIIGLLGGKHLA